ncbi:MAG: YebG family protein [Thermodesulfobacteriota bacterium]
MAVIVKYIVVRNGEEKMTFATKKEADAYDKMLDIADNLFEFLEKSKIKLNETQLEEISLLFAENRMELIPVLRGIKPPQKKVAKTATKPAAKKSLPKKTKTKK